MDDGAGPDFGQREDPDTGAHPGASSARGNPQPDLRQVSRDWIDLWESELSALAVDREARETWQALIPLWTGASIAGAAWAGAWSAALKAAMGQSTFGGPSADDHPDRRARAEPAPRTAPTAAAPDSRDDEIERLTRHVAELEARLAALERDRGGVAGGGRKRKR